MDDRIEGRQQAHRFLRRAARGIFLSRPIPIDAIDARMRQPLFGPQQGALQLTVPLRRGKPQPAHEDGQDRSGQRRVNAEPRVDQCVEPRSALGGIGRPEPMLVWGIDADAALPPRHAQPSAVVHRVQKMSRGT